MRARGTWIPHCEKCLDTGFMPVSEAGKAGVDHCVCWSSNPVLVAKRKRTDARLAKANATRRTRRHGRRL